MEENTKVPSPQPTSRKGIWYVLAVVLLVLFIFGLASNKKQQNNDSVYTATPAVSTAPSIVQRVRTGKYGLLLAPNSIPVGTTKTVSMTMDSAGKDTVGFDVIVSYNPLEVSIGKIVSTKPELIINQYERTPGIIAVTVVKDPKVSTPEIFSNTIVLAIPVTARTAGSHMVKLLEKGGKDEAKFFDNKVTPYYPTVGDVTIQSQ